MDVTDLKGLFAEVKKRMDGQIEHVRRELGGGPDGPRVGHDPRHRARRGLRIPDAAQPGGVALDPRTDNDRGPAVRPVAAGRQSKKAIRNANLG